MWIIYSFLFYDIDVTYNRMSLNSIVPQLNYLQVFLVIL